MQHSDELSTYSDELALGGAADALASRMDALASAHASGGLSEALDMLDVEAGTGLDDSSLDDIARSALVKTRDMEAALDLLDDGATAAVDDVAELAAAGLPRDLQGGLAALAIHQRKELLQRVHEVGEHKIKCHGAVALARAAAQTRTGSMTQSSTRKLGKYDKKCSGSCCSGAAAAGSAATLGESGCGVVAAELEAP